MILEGLPCRCPLSCPMPFFRRLWLTRGRLVNSPSFCQALSLYFGRADPNRPSPDEHERSLLVLLLHCDFARSRPSFEMRPLLFFCTIVPPHAGPSPSKKSGRASVWWLLKVQAISSSHSSPSLAPCLSYSPARQTSRTFFRPSDPLSLLASETKSSITASAPSPSSRCLR